MSKAQKHRLHAMQECPCLLSTNGLLLIRLTPWDGCSTRSPTMARTMFLMLKPRKKRFNNTSIAPSFENGRCHELENPLFSAQQLDGDLADALGKTELLLLARREAGVVGLSVSKSRWIL